MLSEDTKRTVQTYSLAKTFQSGHISDSRYSFICTSWRIFRHKSEDALKHKFIIPTISMSLAHKCHHDINYSFQEWETIWNWKRFVLPTLGKVCGIARPPLQAGVRGSFHRWRRDAPRPFGCRLVKDAVVVWEIWGLGRRWRGLVAVTTIAYQQSAVDRLFDIGGEEKAGAVLVIPVGPQRRGSGLLLPLARGARRQSTFVG